MSFSDDPIIDKNAERSEESVLAVRNHFNTKSGFICREEHPDLGVDLDVEIRNQNGASGKKFAIQIKSTQNIKIIDSNGQKYVSFSFKTSRLGYLSRRTPAYGLIIIYDEESKKCYYDYVDNIIARKKNESVGEEWEEQENIKIHLPVEHYLTEEVVRNIYNKYTQLFQNHDFLLSKHGRSFQIPVIEDNSVENLSIEDIEDSIPYLINEQQFALICRLVSSFKRSEVIQYKKLTLFGAFAFSETGQVIEAKYFLNRCARFRDKLDDFEQEILIFTQLKVDLLSGDMSLEELGDVIQDNLPKFKNPINIINLRLNLYYYEAFQRVSINKFDEIFESNILSFFQDIESLDISEAARQQLVVQHCDALEGYLISMIVHQAIAMKINSDNGSTNFRNTFIRSQNIANILTQKLLNAIDYAQKEGQDLLKAEVLFKLARVFVGRQFNLALVESAPILTEELFQDFNKSRLRFMLAYNTYLDHQRYHEAYLSLHYLLDLKCLFRIVYDRELVGENDDQLSEIARSLEIEMGFKPYKSVIFEGLNRIKEIRNNPNVQVLEFTSDEQLTSLARNIQFANDLPEDRFNHIVSDLKAYRLFEQVCKNPDIEMLQNQYHTFRKETHYKTPCIYTLRSKKTGIETPPHQNIEVLLKMFEHILMKK